MAKITFTMPGGDQKTVSAADGVPLLPLMRQNQLDIDAPCAGNGVCGKCLVQLTVGQLAGEKTRHLNEDAYAQGWRLACACRVAGDAAVTVPDGAVSFCRGIRTADLSTGQEMTRYRQALAEVFASGIAPGCREQGVGLAVDIGTTTVTAALLELNGGEVLAKASVGNGQIRYGADVINRIIASGRPGGREALQQAVREDTLLPLVTELCAQAGQKPAQISRCVIVGNTTMEHLLVGADAQTIRVEPYQPAFLELPGQTAALLGLPFAPQAPVLLAPNVGSYVGGDITAGVLTLPIWRQSQISLFLDLGTNGELVLGNEDFLLCCACSAGPAFEGGDISCGMRATAGAVESVSIATATGEPSFTVIGGGKPAGLCGSGLIDLISELFRCGIVDAGGKFVAESRRILRQEDGAAYVLAFAEEAAQGKPVLLTEIDLDNFIRAKAAVFSAIRAMLRSLDMTVEMIDHVDIAGGIGSGIDMAKAISIGMLPKLPPEKYRYVGNTALTGACAMLLSDQAVAKVTELAHNMTYLELSSHPGYMEEFVAACFLPHTDASLFR